MLKFQCEHLKHYTVPGVYEGCSDRYASTVIARNATEALAYAKEERKENNKDADVPVLFCGVVMGEHRPLDAAYAQPGWQRHVVVNERIEATGDSHQCNSDLVKHTVITTEVTHFVEAKDVLDAVLAFRSEEVAAVLAGHVDNEFPRR